MLIALPPSEKKSGEGDGPPLDLAGLSFPELNPIRERVLATLAEVCCEDTASQVLALPPSQSAEALERNRRLYEAPTLPVSRLYTGVLYDNLALGDLDEAALRDAEERIVVLSGLWGALRLTDRIPPYRLAMAVSLPPLGRLAALWRPALQEALRPEGLVVDMRSAPYAVAWRPAVPTVTVRVFRERVLQGVPKRTVVSHMAKATRGKVAHDLLKAGADPASPEELLKAVCDLGYTAELNDGGANLDVILHA
ncbi:MULTISPECIES: YaaA family protein [Thermomonospora]|uniref:Cytoplasmic iron level regulating protein YaaA (DUF328/UPF0246 family) n=1 Tax=Thermomonospora cellulosilytica TaxID=1411118 RepID=A0A7W3MYS4_9ACTN|nr:MULTISPECIES: peroxide stress protein YaaA [Thermomonospora]MBA9004389.1 cytoplasmic iron level regulating protein YaaA (DUF328/UPF0246 family) [Thermomonospora cellulosilytica]